MKIVSDGSPDKINGRINFPISFQIAKLIIEYYDLYTNRMMPIANEEVVSKFNIDKLTYQLVRYFEFLRDIPPEFGIKRTKPEIENQY